MVTISEFKLQNLKDFPDASRTVGDYNCTSFQHLSTVGASQPWTVNQDPFQLPASHDVQWSVSMDGWCDRKVFGDASIRV